MSDKCIFCRIAHGTAEASIVYEDSTVISFLDIQQFHPGHALVVPKAHVPDIFDLDDETGAALMSTLRRVSRAVDSAFSPDGINIWQSSRAAAGQDVFHLHFHVLPRHTGDYWHYSPVRRSPSKAELTEQAAAIRGAMAST